MADRFWGEEKDKIAANQLGLTEDYTIFMMANRGEFIPDEDYDAVEDELGAGDLWTTSEIVHAVREKEKEVILPGAIQLVGMCPAGKAEPKVYGVVDFSESARLLEDSMTLTSAYRADAIQLPYLKTRLTNARKLLADAAKSVQDKELINAIENELAQPEEQGIFILDEAPLYYEAPISYDRLVQK